MTRPTVTCPNCDRLGTLVVGLGRYPYVAHDDEIGFDLVEEITDEAAAALLDALDDQDATGSDQCFIPRDHPLVVAELAHHTTKE